MVHELCGAEYPNKPQQTPIYPNIIQYPWLGKSKSMQLQWLSRNVVAGTGWLLMAAGRCSLPSWVPTGVTSTDSWRNKIAVEFIGRFIWYSSDPLVNIYIYVCVCVRVCVCNNHNNTNNNNIRYMYAFNCQYNCQYNFYRYWSMMVHGQITSSNRRTECANKSNKAKQHDVRCRTPFLHSLKLLAAVGPCGHSQKQNKMAPAGSCPKVPSIRRSCFNESRGCHVA